MVLGLLWGTAFVLRYLRCCWHVLRCFCWGSVHFSYVAKQQKFFATIPRVVKAGGAPAKEVGPLNSRALDVPANV